MENLIMLSLGIFASAVLFYVLGTLEDKKKCRERERRDREMRLSYEKFNKEVGVYNANKKNPKDLSPEELEKKFRIAAEMSIKQYGRMFKNLANK